MTSEFLTKLIGKDHLALWYQGVFNDQLTNDMIELSEFDVSEEGLGKSKKRLSFLMAESFQNIVRHGLKDASSDSIPGTFGIHNANGIFHIFSANNIPNSAAQMLSSKLDQVNSLNPDELKEYYREILNNGVISEKGGGGLGLIEMARKSGRPLAYQFKELGSETEFCMQINRALSKENAESATATPIAENVALKTTLADEGVLLLFKGDFNQHSIGPVLHVLTENLNSNRNLEPPMVSIFHIGVELLQNISRHGAADGDHVPGVFILGEKDGRMYMTTFNYIEVDQATALQAHLEKINAANKEELNVWYRNQLRESTKNDSNSAGVGLIDIGRITAHDITFGFEHENGKVAFSITATT